MRSWDMVDVLPTSIENLVKYLVDSGNVSRIVLFGSRARGDAREHSDYDLAIWVIDRAAWSRLAVELLEKPITLLPVDTLLYDEASPEYQARIDREGIVLYGAK